MEQQITLYSFADFDRSGRVRWALHELELSFNEVRLDYAKGEHRTEAFLDKNPFGMIPTLEIEGKSIFESGAICTYLADAYSTKLPLAPAPTSAHRASYNQWCYFACTSLETRVFPVLKSRRHQPETAEKEKELIAELDKVLAPLARTMQSRYYLVGDEFSMADILTGYSLGLADKLGLLNVYTELNAYLMRLKNREAAKKSKVFDPWPN
jgi:glutathione S-transferase